MLHIKNPKEESAQENINPFDEFILSWNGTRPSVGKISFYISVKLDEWSSDLLYASWTKEEQSSFCSKDSRFPVRSYQDVIEVMEGKKATGFRIKIVAEEGAFLQSIRALHAYTNGGKREKSEVVFAGSLHVNGLSQMVLNHPRAKDLCSPTSVAAVVRYLLQKDALDPVALAMNCRDCKFDIFGNWVLNVAAASHELGSSWDAWVERLGSFGEVCSHLHKKMPVIVSVRGPLNGSALPYANGHLLVVHGFDPDKGSVLCMDPAFASNETTRVEYLLDDFMAAWERRGRIAYIFSEAANALSCIEK